MGSKAGITPNCDELSCPALVQCAMGHFSRAKRERRLPSEQKGWERRKEEVPQRLNANTKGHNGPYLHVLSSCHLAQRTCYNDAAASPKDGGGSN